MTNTDIDKAGKVKPTLIPVMIACEQRYERKKKVEWKGNEFHQKI
jgi:hypothetical protein